jgi:hypothetical protein
MADAFSSNGVNQSGNVIEPYHSRRGTHRSPNHPNLELRTNNFRNRPEAVLELVGLDVHTLPHHGQQVAEANGAVHVPRATG